MFQFHNGTHIIEDGNNLGLMNGNILKYTLKQHIQRSIYKMCFTQIKTVVKNYTEYCLKILTEKGYCYI